MRKLICLLGKMFFVVKKRKLPKKINKVLLLKAGAIGDVLMTTPLIRLLAKKGLTVDYCVGKYAKIGVEGNKYIDKIISFDDDLIYRKKNIKAVWNLVKTIRKENYDIIFVLDKIWTASVFASWCGRFLIGFDRYGEGFANNLNVRYGPVKHEREYYVSLAKFLGYKTKDLSLDLFISKEDRKYADDFFKKHKIKSAICLIPGGAKNPSVGVDDVRRWPLENYVSLTKRIKKPVILVGGPDDKEINEQIIKKSGKKDVWNLAGKCRLGESVAVMAKCAKIVCNDSGPMHMASAVNKHVISLFGPSNPARKAPLAKESVAIWKDQDIYEEDYEIYGKKPRSKEFMKKIKVEDILRLL